MNSLTSRLAVCSWSLQPEMPSELTERIGATGVLRVQLALDPLRRTPELWADCASRLGSAGIHLASGMFGTLGEDYSTLETIQRTGGIVPDETWTENWKNIQRTAEIAGGLGLRLVTFHAGFLPHEETDPAFARLLDRVRQVADCFAAKGIEVGLETGQETAEDLDRFLTLLDRGNVGVNIDPANIILYDKGHPVRALQRLARWLKQVHIKDAVRTCVPGTWGREVVVGRGEVDWKGFFENLAIHGYSGDLCIEREAGNERVSDIRAAADFVRNYEGSGSRQC